VGVQSCFGSKANIQKETAGRQYKKEEGKIVILAPKKVSSDNEQNRGQNLEDHVFSHLHNL